MRLELIWWSICHYFQWLELWVCTTMSWGSSYYFKYSAVWIPLVYDKKNTCMIWLDLKVAWECLFEIHLLVTVHEYVRRVTEYYKPCQISKEISALDCKMIMMVQKRTVYIVFCFLPLYSQSNVPFKLIYLMYPSDTVS